MLTVVVLPAPLGPKRPKTSPRDMSSVRSSTATIAPNDLLKPLRLIIVLLPGSYYTAQSRSVNSACPHHL